MGLGALTKKLYFAASHFLAVQESDSTLHWLASQSQGCDGAVEAYNDI